MAKPKTNEPVLTPDAKHWWLIRAAYRLAIRDAMNGTAVASGGGGGGGGGGGVTVNASQQGIGGDAQSEGSCGSVSSYDCNNLNEGFTTIDEFNPELQPGAWPPSDELVTQIAQAFTDKKPASTTIPLQLQENILESYRRQLLHKKWRKCHHLNAVNASLVAELRSQDEIERLLLGQQVGNAGRVPA